MIKGLLKKEIAAQLALSCHAVDMAAWLDCAKADPRAVARTVLVAVQRDESGEIFPDDGAKEFWRGFKSDPAGIFFVAPSASAHAPKVRAHRNLHCKD
jgi:hypothetical protein